MYPNLFGLEGFSMTFMIILGVALAVTLLFVFLKFKKVPNKVFLDLTVVISATLVAGILFAILFENTYEAIKHAINSEPQHWTWGMTFYGGLIGGVITFILVYRFYYLRNNEPIMKHILVIVPACICLGHGVGRIGCFLSGCCYGIEDHSWMAVQFPHLDHPVLPTQLIEMIFLFLLAAVLAFLAFKEITYQNMAIYMLFYGIFRFIIEFFRGDERGQLVGLSPSQYVSIMLILGSIVVFYLFKTKFFSQEEMNSNEI